MSAAASRMAGSWPTVRVSAWPMLAVQNTETVSLTTIGADRPRGTRDEVVCADVIRFVHDDELVATEPSHDIGGACERYQPARGLAQHKVAGVVPIGVVDDLEAVEIEERQPRAADHCAGSRQRHLEELVEQVSVSQTGQWITQSTCRQVSCRLRSSVTSRLTPCRPPRMSVVWVSKITIEPSTLGTGGRSEGASVRRSTNGG